MLMTHLDEAKGSSSPTAKTWNPKELLDFFSTGSTAPGTNARRGVLTAAAARSRRRYLPRTRGGLAVASQRGLFSQVTPCRDAAEVEIESTDSTTAGKTGKDHSTGCWIQGFHTAYYARSIIDLGKNKLKRAFVRIS